MAAEEFGTFIPNAAGFREVLESPEGPVGRDLIRRCLRVTAAAKRLCPVDHGRLRSSIRFTIGRDALGLVGIIGTDVDYAIYVHEGTREHDVEPVNKQALWWEGAEHPVLKVTIPARGGRPFLRDALPAAIV